MFKYYIFVFSLIISSGALANSFQFIEGFEDIPLHSNMYQLIDNDITFNNEETGYIETNLHAKKKLNFEEFKKFYLETLPQFGWNLHQNTNNKLIFYRENNILEFQNTGQKPLKITISLKNRN